MKKALRFCKYFFTCLFIFYMLPSCRTVRVTIKSGDPTTQKLEMVDAKGNPADTINTVPGERIKWIIATGSNVKSFTAISEKGTSQNVLSRRAHKKHSSSTWKAKVARKGQLAEIAKPTKVEGKEYYYEEYYFMDWTDQNGGAYKYDPKIAVNPDR